MKLNFTIASHDAMLEAVDSKSNKLYIIYQLNNECEATVAGQHLVFGDLYECLDVCNRYNRIINGGEC